MKGYFQKCGQDSGKATSNETIPTVARTLQATLCRSYLSWPMTLGEGCSQPVITWERKRTRDLAVHPPSTFLAVASDWLNPTRVQRLREPVEAVSMNHLPGQRREEIDLIQVFKFSKNIKEVELNVLLPSSYRHIAELLLRFICLVQFPKTL